MIVFTTIQMSAPKRKSLQSVIIKLWIEDINMFHHFPVYIQSKDIKIKLTECQNDISFNLGSLSNT